MELLVGDLLWPSGSRHCRIRSIQIQDPGMIWVTLFRLTLLITLNWHLNSRFFFCIGCACVQRYMDSEIRAIMAQYMPLDNQGDVPNHSHHIEL